MPERPDERDKLRTVQTVGALLVKAAVVFVTVVVLLQIFGVIDGFDEDPATPEAHVQRLPGEHLYLDDERVDAYLGQLRGGIAPSERQSVSVTRSRNAELALQQVVQVGAKVEEQRVVERTVSSRAADRYYLLEAELMTRFAHADQVGLRFRRVRANAQGCREIASGRAIKSGQIIRITGAHLRVPTYALALAKVAHAAQFLAPQQADAVSPEALSRLAERNQAGLERFVNSFGADPRLPFRLVIRHREMTCTIFLPARYSKLVEAPSLLTGKITVVGKVVRTLAGEGREYFDVETAARYGRAVLRADPAVQDVLGLSGDATRAVVNESARISSPALVVLPLAIYK
ncbi:MAG: DUF6414 family protein [Thermoleophilaceae bacterium]